MKDETRAQKQERFEVWQSYMMMEAVRREWVKWAKGVMKVEYFSKSHLKKMLKWEQAKEPESQSVLFRRHVYPDGWVVLFVKQLPAGFVGTFSNMSRVEEQCDTQSECCTRMDEKFNEMLPDHACGKECHKEWKDQDKIMVDGKPWKQWRNDMKEEAASRRAQSRIKLEPFDRWANFPVN